MHDDEVMDRARVLALAARPVTPPWPTVGCVLVRDGAVVGEGATGPYPTGPHAEVAALAAAGEAARGATACVTLEPCAHEGNTPPCADALIAAGVARVVIGIEDPDPRVAGRGVTRLRDAGITVEVTGDERVADDLAAYAHHRRTGRAFVVAKVAMSLDGRVAAADGSSQWISSEPARADAHRLRADSQAILLGSGTALADRPALTVRGVTPAPRRAPLRVVCDARGRVPATGPLFDTTLAPTLVVTTEAAPNAAVDAWRAAGAKVEIVAPGAQEGTNLDDVLALLGREGVLQVLFEGGGALLGSALAGGHVGRLVVYVAPLVLGEHARPGFALAGPATLADAARYRLRNVQQLGSDVRLDYEVA
ncbi:MAG: bifunctional diaminohydroxyphosphoribosylaminopyrimidine deaminase/5-amino-6-(5-phosphoribosylamino)uracil reductase RibD [Actinomycetota bacterium]